ncbi:ABC transporter permease [Mesorhizobium sp. M5C.F.Ca.IN.020.32.2.1]|uniref:ABC transporter permease n=1 Tax=Mesorhizobium sp. M5C.F.Ca.IN.020.32.2.1 TaxID=2496771 RepID=UPI000FD1AB26|nr:ABC transporter permease [Mesorhizobium sp. M5C.F.Ca.IN.020.32.2.1]RUV26812.1 ABC transporter permease [Mesorhizobium sp. M5C.F.Ca.IN.020.32.2.1]
MGRIGSNGNGFAYVLPLAVVMVIAFNIPILLMLRISVAPSWTLANYLHLAQEEAYLKVLLNTFKVAAITTVCSAVLGYPLAYWMTWLSPTGRLVAIAFVVIPFWVSVLVRSYAWIVLLGNAGLVNRALLSLAVIDQPIGLIYNELGVIIGMTNILIPFIVLPLYAAMARLDRRLLQAAAALGGSDFQTFWLVFFPLTRPALAASALLVFISAIGFYITPALLGGGRVSMIANVLDVLINQVPSWELAAAISAVLLAASVALYALYRRAAAYSGM